MTARISLDPPRTPVYRLAEWYSRRSYGVVADPLAAMGHNPRVLLTDARFETSLAPVEAARPDAEGAGRDGLGGVDRLLLVRRLRLLGQHRRRASTRPSCATSPAGGTATSTPTSSGR